LADRTYVFCNFVERTGWWTEAKNKQTNKQDFQMKLRETLLRGDCCIAVICVFIEQITTHIKSQEQLINRKINLAN